MTDHPTPGSAGQPCIGPDHHGPPSHGQGRRLVAVVTGHAAHLELWQAPAGAPCIGIATTDTGEYLHIARVSVHAAPLIPQAREARIFAEPDEHGQWTEVADHFDELTPAQATALMQAWRAALTEQRIQRRDRQ